MADLRDRVYRYVRKQAREGYSTPHIERIARQCQCSRADAHIALIGLIGEGELMQDESGRYGVLVQSCDGPAWRWTDNAKKRKGASPAHTPKEYGYAGGAMSIFDGHRFEDITRAECRHYRETGRWS